MYYFTLCLPVINILSNAKNVCGNVVKHCKPSFRHEVPLCIISLKQLNTNICINNIRQKIHTIFFKYIL